VLVWLVVGRDDVDDTSLVVVELDDVVDVELLGGTDEEVNG
jgi:hypothetical protein